MPTPAVALKLRKFRRRFGITAPRMVVRSHLPWAWLALPAFLLLLLCSSVIWLVLQRNEAGEIGREVKALRQQILEEREELSLLRSTAGTGQNAMSIERATQQQLLVRIQGLERENRVLKEDILLFERLIPVVGEEAVVRIENFRVIHESGARHRYRILLAFQPGRQNPEFRGRLQLAVSFLLAAKEQQLLLPDKKEAMGEYQLEMKHFLRREGVFELPPGAVLKGVEARVLQGDTLKSKRLAQL
ncbi:MAG: hypothetical protein Q8S26_18095 [Azonexus sp.]|nr:hypothetical protein [Azonexus sp.]